MIKKNDSSLLVRVRAPYYGDTMLISSGGEQLGEGAVGVILISSIEFLSLLPYDR